jgi:hypothetical protein
LGECAECGATGRFGGCAQLFQVLLAMDHQRLQPFGAFHGLNVACYLLQHPSQAKDGVDAEHVELVATFLEGGLASAQRRVRERVRLNRQQQLPASLRAVPPRVHRPTSTIEDLSVDGTFPAEGYAERMERWADSVTRERVGSPFLTTRVLDPESAGVRHARSKSVGGA